MKKDIKTKVPIPPDGGWGWIVTLAAFIAYFIADGWSYSFGVFFQPFLDNFQEGKGKTAIIAALLYGIPLLVSPVVCALTSTYGCRVIAICGGLISGMSFIISYFATSVNFLCVTLGVVSSIGLAMTYVPAIVMVTNYFEKRRGLATGLAVTGSGLGAFAFPPLLEHFISLYGWRGALLITGAIYFNVCAAGGLFRPAPMGYPTITEPEEREGTIEYLEVAGHRDTGVETDALKDNDDAGDVGEREQIGTCAKFSNEVKMIFRSMLDRSLASNLPFLLFCASSFLLYLWNGIPYVYLIDKATSHSISIEHASFLLSIIGIGRTIGQIILGILGDVPAINTILLYGICVVVCGLDTMMLPFMHSFAALCAYSAIYGFFTSATYALQMMCIVEITGLEKSTNAFGLFQLVQGIGTVLGTAIPGWMFDKTQNYALSFYISGGLMMLSGFMLFPMPLMVKKAGSNSQKPK